MLRYAAHPSRTPLFGRFGLDPASLHRHAPLWKKGLWGSECLRGFDRDVGLETQLGLDDFAKASCIDDFFLFFVFSSGVLGC